MKKNVIKLFAFPLMGLLYAGCGSSSGGKDDGQTSSQQPGMQQQTPPDSYKGVNLVQITDANKLKSYLQLSSANEWAFARNGFLRAVDFDASQSHDSGTGSALLSHSDPKWEKTDRLLSTFLLPVQAGAEYTLSFWSKADSLQPSLEVYGVFWDQNKNEIVNSKGSQIANSKTDVWEQGFIHIKVPENQSIKYFTFKIYMQHQGIDGKIWVDDFDFKPGLQLPARSAKRAFNGTVTRVDTLGNMKINDGSGWKDFFPIALVDVDTNRDLSVYANQGFNMKLNAWSPQDVKDAYAKGIYTALNITLPMMYDNQSVSEISNRQQAILNDHDAANKLLFYYVDNEFFNRKQRVIDTVQRIRNQDQEARPIFMLQGDYALTRKYNDLSDIAGAYVATNRLDEDHSIIEQPSMFEYEIMDRTPNQEQPVVFAEITRGVQQNFRPVLFGSIAKGARGVAFWRDGGTAGDITKRAWWSDLPTVKSEIDKMMQAGIIQADHNPNFQVTTSNKKVIIGRRVVGSVGYIIAANPTNHVMTLTCTLENLGYTPSELQDFISDVAVGTVSGNSVTFAIPAYGSKVIKLVQ